MNKFLFLFLSSLLSALATAMLAGIVGIIHGRFHSDHAHQIIPTWMILMVIGFIFAFVIGLIWNIFLIYRKKEISLLKSMYPVIIIAFMLNILVLFSLS